MLPNTTIKSAFFTSSSLTSSKERPRKENTVRKYCKYRDLYSSTMHYNKYIYSDYRPTRNKFTFITRYFWYYNNSFIIITIILLLSVITEDVLLSVTTENLLQ